MSVGWHCGGVASRLCSRRPHGRPPRRRRCGSAVRAPRPSARTRYRRRGRRAPPPPPTTTMQPRVAGGGRRLGARGPPPRERRVVAPPRAAAPGAVGRQCRCRRHSAPNCERRRHWRRHPPARRVAGKKVRGSAVRARARRLRGCAPGLRWRRGQAPRRCSARSGRSASTRDGSSPFCWPPRARAGRDLAYKRARQEGGGDDGASSALVMAVKRWTQMLQL